MKLLFHSITNKNGAIRRGKQSCTLQWEIFTRATFNKTILYANILYAKVGHSKFIEIHEDFSGLGCTSLN
jgi:hypothetical protein